VKIKEESETFINRFWLAISFEDRTKHLAIFDMTVVVVVGGGGGGGGVLEVRCSARCYCCC